MARFTRDVCKCDFGDKICLRLALDELNIDMTRIVLRIDGVLAALESDGDTVGTVKELTDAIVRRTIPPKEMLRVQARGERCIYHAAGRRFR